MLLEPGSPQQVMQLRRLQATVTCLVPPAVPGVVWPQLVIPSGLIAACLERLSVLSSRYHDEECDDLNEVTWQQLASRVGLHIEVGLTGLNTGNTTAADTNVILHVQGLCCCPSVAFVTVCMDGFKALQ